MTSTEETTGRPTLATVVQLGGIVLRDLEWKMPEIQIPPQLPISLEPAFELGFGTGEGLVAFRATMTLPGTISIEDVVTEIFRLRATFQAQFNLPSAFAFDQSEIKQFGELSAFPMIYPYFRELANTTAYRAGFQGISLPPLPYTKTTQSSVLLEHPDTSPRD